MQKNAKSHSPDRAIRDILNFGLAIYKVQTVGYRVQFNWRTSLNICDSHVDFLEALRMACRRKREDEEQSECSGNDEQNPTFHRCFHRSYKVSFEGSNQYIIDALSKIFLSLASRMLFWDDLHHSFGSAASAQAPVRSYGSPTRRAYQLLLPSY